MFTRSYACMPPNDFCMCYKGHPEISQRLEGVGGLVLRSTRQANYYVGVGRWVLSQCYAANFYRSTNSLDYASDILTV